MEPKSYRETTTKSWGDKIGAAFRAAAFGLALCAGGVTLHWWNEGRTIHRERSLEESNIQVVAADVARIDSNNEGRIVHLTGRFEVLKEAVDPELGFGLSAARLKRSVEMFQWDEKKRSETEEQIGGGSVKETDYSYRGVWSSREINSSKFQKSGYVNPGPLPFPTATFDSSNVKLGAFTLSHAAVASLPGWEAVPSDEQLANLLTPVLSRVRTPVQPAGGWIFAGRDPVSPRVGDIRIRYEAILPKEISILAKQSGETLVPHITSKQNEVILVASGAKSAFEMISDAQKQNKTLAWGLRGGGVLLLYLGIRLLLGPLAALTSVVPFLGRAVGLTSGLAAFVLALGISLMVMGISWLAHRPIIGLSTLTGAILLTFSAGAMRGKTSSASRTK